MRRSLAVAALALLAALPAGGDTDPWSALDGVRRQMAAAGGLAAEFTQSFTPAGFRTGEVESGRIAIALPDCLRWDYLEPYRKSFLVCGSRAHSWVEGEPRGQRATIEARHEMGLDLLLLPISELETRYRATVQPTSENRLDLALEPIDPEAPLAAVNLTLDPAGARLVALDYRDREGNVTSFRFTGYGPLADPDAFTPPPDIDWAEP